MDVQVSGTWQSNPGPELAANYVATNAVIAAGPQPLGRALSGGRQRHGEPDRSRGRCMRDRRNNLDFRVAKILRFGRTRTQVGLDIYNAHEHRCGHDLQPDVLADEYHVADADGDSAGAVRQGQRAVRLLEQTPGFRLLALGQSLNSEA